ncbi:NADH dehydrogenase [ubiquinone] 1 alpha subcomplex assembly factor 4-like [Lineus longissimus]|uniref:NADH dehydrogenase [ubiquinone] 1 alpha subcomplex assembly factor 4-like n=1 Tax=Lineus longissimus TaxID=88925 RepID=UPI002B4E26AC
MGKTLSTIGKRASQRFNFENRAQRAIEKQKTIPKAAPRHPSTVEQLKTIEQRSEIKEEIDRRNESLLDKLKQVRIESHGPPPEIKSARHLPQNRIYAGETESGFEEPNVIPPGKLTVRTLMDVLGKAMVEPKTYTAREIAAEHSLDRQKVENMLKYFAAFSLHIPKAGEVPVAGKLRSSEKGSETVELEDKTTMLEEGKKESGFKINILTKKPED